MNRKVNLAALRDERVNQKINHAVRKTLLTLPGKPVNLWKSIEMPPDVVWRGWRKA
jgi:hypothetical protein